MDSISLGQLRAIAPPNPKPKQAYYDFRYDDEDTTFNEIEEFYSYAELPQIDENYRAWQGSFDREWTNASAAAKQVHMALLLETLEHKDSEVRFTNARRLLYLLQGAFAESTSQEHQLYCIVENSKCFRASNGIAIVKDAIKIANAKHDLLHSWSEVDTNHFNISLQDKAEFIEEVCTELSIYLGMLYHVIQVMKGDHNFADELMSLDTPLPIFLFNMVAGLKDKSPKGYPVKKLVLTVWKCLIACFGGFREHLKVKQLCREVASLSGVDGTSLPIKTSPTDMEMFRTETAIKYPTFIPPATSAPSGNFPHDVTRKLSQIDLPIPVRHPYHQHDSSNILLHNNPSTNALFQVGQPTYQNRNAHQIASTPMPTPPPSPKPKKQQFQTDQTRPFLFPFSSTANIGSSAVPYAIEEADRLYGRHMHLSVAAWQTWQVRDECVREEAGLGPGATEQGGPVYS